MREADDQAPEQTSRISELMSFSDLARSDMPAFRERWASMSPAERESTARELVELAEMSIDANFHRVFREVLDDPNPRVRQAAIEGLWEDEGSELPARYLALMRDDPDPDVRAEAATALQPYLLELSEKERDSEARGEFLQSVLAIANDPRESPLLRRRCIETAGALASDPDVQALIREAYADDDQTLAAGAVRAMGLSGQARWIPEIERALESADAEMRFEGAVAAGLLGESALVEALAVVAEDEDVEVQAAAIDALGRVGGPAAVRVLRALESSDAIVDRDAVADALEEAMMLDELGALRSSADAGLN
jgi:HEAT repeat protein